MAAATRRREKRKLGFQWGGMIQAREWFGYSYGYGVVCTFAKGPKYISRKLQIGSSKFSIIQHMVYLVHL